MDSPPQPDQGPASLAAILSTSARRQSVNGQALLVQKGDALSDAFVVLEGMLRVFALNPRGREAVLYRLGPGQLCLLSLNAAFTGGTYPANVSVESAAAVVARVPGSVLRRLFAEEPAVQALVLTSLTATIEELMRHLDAALLSPLRERLIQHLTRRADVSRTVVTTQQALADQLGASREAVSRELADMRRSGLVSTRRGEIVLRTSPRP